MQNSWSHARCIKTNTNQFKPLVDCRVPYELLLETGAVGGGIDAESADVFAALAVTLGLGVGAADPFAGVVN